MPTLILKKHGGFTLLEVLIATFVLVLGIVSTFLFFTNAMTSTQYAADVTTATSHAEYVFEEMKTRAALSDITNTNWTTWAQNENLNTLPQESIVVQIADAQGDPLDIQLAVNWTRKSRQNNVNLRTQMTK